MIGLNVIYCLVCTGRGWTGNRHHRCPYCGGSGITGVIKNGAIKDPEPMTDLKKTIRKSTTVTTTVALDRDAVTRILAAAAGAPDSGADVQIDEYTCTATITWSTTETETDDPVLTTRELAEKAVRK